MHDAHKAGEVTIIVGNPRSRERTIALDHIEVRTTSRDAVRAAGLLDGDLLSETSLEDALGPAEREMATRRAIRLLEHRERSATELLDKIVADGYPQPVARAVVDRMVELELVDDSRFTEFFIRTKVASRWGRRRIERALTSAGIDELLAGEALDSMLPPEAEVHRAEQLLPPIDSGDRRMQEKQLRRLVTRGYSYQDAREAVSRAVEKEDESPRNQS